MLLLVPSFYMWGKIEDPQLGGGVLFPSFLIKVKLILGTKLGLVTQLFHIELI